MPELQLFDTELDMTPVDLSKTEDKKEESTQQTTQEESEYTIIDVLDKDTSKAEETETAEEEESQETATSSDESADSSKFPYSTFAKALYEEGVLSFFDEDEYKKLVEETGSEVEAMIELNRRTIVDQVEAYKNSLSPEGKAFLDAIEKGVPLDKYVNIKTKEYQYSTIKEDALTEDDELCKRIMRDDLKQRGFDDDEIEDQIKDADDLGKLENKAKVSLKRLKASQAEAIRAEKEEAERRTQQQIEENKRQMTAIKTEVDKVSEIIPGVKVNAKLKGQIYEAITTPEKQMPNGQWLNKIYAKRAENPVAWDIKVAYLYSLGVFDDKWDAVMSKSKSAAVKDLTEKLNSGTVSKTGEPGKTEQSKSSKDILKSMEVFKKK